MSDEKIKLTDKIRRHVRYIMKDERLSEKEFPEVYRSFSKIFNDGTPDEKKIYHEEMDKRHNREHVKRSNE